MRVFAVGTLLNLESSSVSALPCKTVLFAAEIESISLTKKLTS